MLKPSDRHLLLFFALAYGISWMIWAPLWLPAFGIDTLPVLPFHHAWGAVGPIAAAFLVAGMEAGAAGPRDLLRRMVLWRGRLLWVLLALLAPLGVLAFAALAAWLFTGEEGSLAGVGVSREFPQFSALGFLVYNLFSFGYGEEVGWRGYALPRLQAKYSALVATLLLTLGWALWHVPLFLYRPGYTSMGATGIAGWFFSLLTGAVLLTWLFNESRGSILVVALFHAAIDVAFTSDISSPFVVNAAGVIVTLWGLTVLVVAGPRHLSRKGKVVALPDDGGETVEVHLGPPRPPHMV